MSDLPVACTHCGIGCEPDMVDSDGICEDCVLEFIEDEYGFDDEDFIEDEFYDEYDDWEGDDWDDDEDDW